MFSSNYGRYHLVVYRRFHCFEYPGVNFTPSILPGNGFEWSKKIRLKSLWMKTIQKFNLKK